MKTLSPWRGVRILSTVFMALSLRPASAAGLAALHMNEVFEPVTDGRLDAVAHFGAQTGSFPGLPPQFDHLSTALGLLPYAEGRAGIAEDHRSESMRVAKANLVIALTPLAPLIGSLSAEESGLEGFPTSSDSRDRWLAAHADARVKLLKWRDDFIAAVKNETGQVALQTIRLAFSRNKQTLDLYLTEREIRPALQAFNDASERGERRLKARITGAWGEEDAAEAIAPRAILNADQMAAALKIHAPLVRRVAHHMIGRLPANVEVDDLIQVGMMALQESIIPRFDPNRGATFQTYASQRLQGRMLDYLREIDPLSRQYRRGLRNLNSVEASLEQELFRTPRTAEIAARAGISVNDIHKIRSNQAVSLTSESPGADNEEYDILERIPAGERDGPELSDALSERMMDVVDGLETRLANVLSWFVVWDIKGTDIARILGVTESRVCQLWKDAIEKIKNGAS